MFHPQAVPCSEQGSKGSEQKLWVYGGTSAEFSNYVLSVGFPSERDKEEVVLFCLCPVQTGSPRCNEVPLPGGASTFLPRGCFL